MPDNLGMHRYDKYRYPLNSLQISLESYYKELIKQLRRVKSKLSMSKKGNERQIIFIERSFD